MPEVDSYRQQRTCGNCAFCYFAGLEEREAVMCCYFADGEAVEIDHICDGHEWKNKREIKMKIEFDWTKEKPKVDGYYFVTGPNEDDEVLIRNIEPGSNDHFDTWFSHIEMPEHPLIGLRGKEKEEEKRAELKWTHNCCLNCKHFELSYNLLTKKNDGACTYCQGPDKTSVLELFNMPHFPLPYYAAVRICDLHEKNDD